MNNFILSTAIPCLTADKREIRDFPKLASQTSFICKTLSAIANFSGKIGKILAKEGKDDKEKVGEIS